MAIMAETVQINLRVEEETKENWKEFIEDTEVSPTISHLIRTSVNSRVESFYEETDDEEPEWSADIKDMKSEVEAIRKDVSQLLKDQRDEDDISELAQDVFDSLETLPTSADNLEIPEDTDPTQYRRQRAANMVITPSDKDDTANPQTVSALAERFDEDTDRIERAIDHLQDNFLPVVEVQIDGARHYFREE